MAEFTPIKTQEELDAVIKERLSRQAKKFEGFISPDDMKATLDGFVSREEVEKTENEYKKKIASYQSKMEELSKEPEQLRKEIETLQEKNKGYELDAIKNKVAGEKGLPFGSVEFIQGTTAEDIEESAEKLKKMMKINRPFKMPLAGTENGSANLNDPKKEALKKLAKKLSTEEE